ncbi:hypothetical protein GCM10023172_18150 [Hymenobacter ginsengisoli]|uniref:Uncharacterized protein n=1 Tax=Hymenobacter ginsengisoli TaxID=1051626 RepID=A0ABP8Q9F4_9BACT
MQANGALLGPGRWAGAPANRTAIVTEISEQILGIAPASPLYCGEISNRWPAELAPNSGA